MNFEALGKVFPEYLIPGMLAQLSQVMNFEHLMWNARRTLVQRSYEGAWLLAETDDWQGCWKEKP